MRRGMDGWRGLLLLAAAGAQVVFPREEAAGVRACRPGEACIAKDACPAYRSKLLQRRQATALDKQEERKVLVEELRAMVCNKAEKRVCCPRQGNGEVLGGHLTTPSPPTPTPPATAIGPLAG